MKKPTTKKGIEAREKLYEEALAHHKAKWQRPKSWLSRRNRIIEAMDLMSLKELKHYVWTLSQPDPFRLSDKDFKAAYF